MYKFERETYGPNTIREDMEVILAGRLKEEGFDVDDLHLDEDTKNRIKDLLPRVFLER